MALPHTRLEELTALPKAVARLRKKTKKRGGASVEGVIGKTCYKGSKGDRCPHPLISVPLNSPTIIIASKYYDVVEKWE